MRTNLNTKFTQRQDPLQFLPFQGIFIIKSFIKKSHEDKFKHKIYAKAGPTTIIALSGHFCHQIIYKRNQRSTPVISNITYIT